MVSVPHPKKYTTMNCWKALKMRKIVKMRINSIMWISRQCKRKSKMAWKNG